MSTGVILLNADYTPISTISWQKAICLIVKKKVEVIKASNRVITNFDRSISIIVPTIIRLIKLIRSIFKTKVPYSKRNVLVRDGNICAYCGIPGKNMTIDHIIPKSLGGKSTFENTVCACLTCNNKKDNRNCNEANMYPKHCRPVAPTIMEFLMKSFKHDGLESILKEAGVI